MILIFIAAPHFFPRVLRVVRFYHGPAQNTRGNPKKSRPRPPLGKAPCLRELPPPKAVAEGARFIENFPGNGIPPPPEDGAPGRRALQISCKRNPPAPSGHPPLARGGLGARRPWSCSKGPLVKGGWHGAAVTGGFFYSELLQAMESPAARERRTGVVAPYRFPVNGIPPSPRRGKGPLVKGGWHGAAVTGGFFFRAAPGDGGSYSSETAFQFGQVSPLSRRLFRGNVQCPYRIGW